MCVVRPPLGQKKIDQNSWEWSLIEVLISN